MGARGDSQAADSAAPYVNLRDAEAVRHGSALNAVRSNESVYFQTLGAFPTRQKLPAAAYLSPNYFKRTVL